MRGEVSACAHAAQAARASCGAEARRTPSTFLLRVKRGAELDICHSSLRVQHNIPADYSLQPPVGKSEQKEKKKKKTDRDGKSHRWSVLTCSWAGQHL